MTKGFTLALDVMGGDDAPAMVLRGANIARQRHPDVHFLLVGARGKIEPTLSGSIS